jgi:hypothetical protein
LGLAATGGGEIAESFGIGDGDWRITLSGLAGITGNVLFPPPVKVRCGPGVENS